MNKVVVLFVLAAIVFSCTTPGIISDKQIHKRNYTEVIGDTTLADKHPDKFAMYPNGENGVNQHIRNTIRYPNMARRNGVQGTVILRYVIEKDGTIKEIEVIQSVHPQLDAEAKRVIKAMERWVPGCEDGKPVRIEYRQPFTFKLT